MGDVGFVQYAAGSMQQHRPMQKPPSDTPLPPTRTLPATPPAPWWGIPALRHMRADYLGFVTTLQQRHGDLIQALLAPDS